MHHFADDTERLLSCFKIVFYTKSPISSQYGRSLPLSSSRCEITLFCALIKSTVSNRLSVVRKRNVSDHSYMHRNARKSVMHISTYNAE